jgi:phosphatidylserine/phosphatidylglycerophosphate/cardiolipin synthase-like enzyme
MAEIRGGGGMKRNLTVSILCAILVGASAAWACTVVSYFSPYEEIATVLEAQIHQSTQTIHCSLFGIYNKVLTAALIQAAKHGVEVQIGLDKKQASLPSSTHLQLKHAGALVFIKRIGVLEHDKWCIYDGERVSEGSWNWSENAQHQDNSELILTRCSLTASGFEAAFQRIKQRDLLDKKADRDA